jgi:phosphatidate cytidylyltransferase
MLKKRIITGILIALLLIGILFFAPVVYAEILLSLIVCLGLWEWISLMKLQSFKLRLFYILFFLLVFFISIWTPFVYFMTLSVLLWLPVIFFLYFSFPKETFLLSPGFKALWGCFILIPFWIAIAYLLHLDQHVLFLLFLLLSISGFDTGAFFAGKAWGRHKLAAHVSPNKSIEGVLGGLLCTGILVSILSFCLNYSLSKGLFMIILCLLTGLISCIGDLLESAMKRSAGVKDSGTLLPGHGGILDRIDAYTAGAPFFALMVYLFY